MGDTIDTVKHVRRLHSRDARKYVRTLSDLLTLQEIREGEKRATVRDAADGRISRIRKEQNPRVWRPREPDAVIRKELDPTINHHCPCCKRDLPIGDDLDEIGVRRKRNLVRDGVEYVICAQSYCRRCQNQYTAKQRQERKT